jgi:hypothetical protein
MGCCRVRFDGPLLAALLLAAFFLLLASRFPVQPSVIRSGHLKSLGQWASLGRRRLASGHDSDAGTRSKSPRPPSGAADGRLTPAATPAAAAPLGRTGLLDRNAADRRRAGFPHRPGGSLTAAIRGDIAHLRDPTGLSVSLTDPQGPSGQERRFATVGEHP